MTASTRIRTQVALVVLVVAGLAAANWVLLPAKATTWMIAIATAIGMWLVVTLMGRARSYESYTASERNFLSASIIAAGALLAAALLRHTANAVGFSGGELVDRALGVGGGLVLLLLGNAMPKVLSPLAAKRCNPAQVQSIQRVSGWAFVLAGIVAIATSLLLPLSVAQNLTMIATASALLITLLRLAWAFRAPPRSSPTET